MAPSPPVAQQQDLPCYTRQEIFTHRKLDDCWIAIHGEVYNVTSWLKRHPGGARLIMHYAGEDASAAWTSFHNNKALSRKYMAAYHIGHVVDGEKEQPEITKDFFKLRAELEEKGMFKVQTWFFVALFAHIFALHFLGWWMLWYFGNYWWTWVVSACLIVISQAQAGWLQHDFGHHTVFNSTKLNHFLHDITICLMKLAGTCERSWFNDWFTGHLNYPPGVSSFWWNYRHFQHHAKPNVFLKDPDITIPYVLLLGKRIPKIWGERHWGKLPYHLQQHYFFFVGPPLLLPFYFHVEVLVYVFRKKLWKDFILMGMFYLIFHLTFAHLLGGFWASFRWYFFIRFLESHWFTWVTQISHLPMEIDTDKRKDWVSMQLAGTCDIERTWFNDWFTGHLNYQIEHHLFPTMPRHNFSTIRPRVMEFCNKHGVEFKMKTLWQSLCDVVISLRESGQTWLEAWDIHLEDKTK